MSNSNIKICFEIKEEKFLRDTEFDFENFSHSVIFKIFQTINLYSSSNKFEEIKINQTNKKRISDDYPKFFKKITDLGPIYKIRIHDGVTNLNKIERLFLIKDKKIKDKKIKDKKIKDKVKFYPIGYDKYHALFPTIDTEYSVQNQFKHKIYLKLKAIFKDISFCESFLEKIFKEKCYNNSIETRLNENIEKQAKIYTIENQEFKDLKIKIKEYFECSVQKV